MTEYKSQNIEGKNSLTENKGCLKTNDMLKFLLDLTQSVDDKPHQKKKPNSWNNVKQEMSIEFSFRRDISVGDASPQKSLFKSNSNYKRRASKTKYASRSISRKSRRGKP